MSRRLRADRALILDLISVLSQQPTGLRRWSVMRAMKTLSEKANREVSPKFEDDVERAFRRHCEGDSVHTGMADKPQVLFFRPKESVGEVWAVHRDKAEAWMKGGNLAA
jgi:hypothetical protein